MHIAHTMKCALRLCYRNVQRHSRNLTTWWGPVQVEITVSNGQITNVSTLQYPNGDRRSLNISNQVLPWLQQEALRTQSTNITGISGATYTSNGFRTSLASALQKAGL